MKRIIVFLLVLVFQVYSQTCAVDSSFPSFNPNVYHYQTSDSVRVLRNNIGSVTPPVQTPPNAASYLSSSSSLSYNGPIGPYGPLGSLGPLGSNSWNPSTWISGTGYDWSTYSSEISGLGGPLSASGPLGSTGPLSEPAYYTDMPCINDFSEQLSAGGLWTVLGPLGPMGPAGALGPLGPIGAHGYTRDTNGQYVSNGNVVRSITVPWTSTTTRTWDLFEHYKQSYAALKTDNDCSFFVEGLYGAYGANGDKYKFRSAVAQYVTILLVPLKHLDTWRLTIKNSLGNTIKVVGPDSFYPNWAQIRVPANTQLTVEVHLHSSLHLLASDYRLYVSGSSSFIAPATHIQGPHLLSYTPV